MGGKGESVNCYNSDINRNGDNGLTLRNSSRANLKNSRVAENEDKGAELKTIPG